MFTKFGRECYTLKTDVFFHLFSYYFCYCAPKPSNVTVLFDGKNTTSLMSGIHNCFFIYRLKCMHTQHTCSNAFFG